MAWKGLEFKSTLPPPRSACFSPSVNLPQGEYRAMCVCVCVYVALFTIGQNERKKGVEGRKNVE